MFTGISWQSYLLLVGAASAIYYFYVVTRYYRNDLVAWVTNKANGRPPSKAATTPVQVQGQQPEETPATVETSVSNESEYDELEHLIGRINTTIGDAATRKANPEELKGYLTLVFREYPSLKNDGMRPAINELVASECAKYNIPISEAEADRLWEQ